MAGHSKWANIKHKKAAEDHKRGKEFSKVSRGIRSAVRETGSGDPDTNINLRLWLDKAKEINLPKENIKRAIEAGLGKGQEGSLQEVVYEGFDSKGIGIMVVCMTDNKNRTTAEIRFVLSRAGGSLGSPGSVKYMFQRDSIGRYQCTISFSTQDQDHHQQLQQLIDSLLELDDVEGVYCSVEELNQVNSIE